jgi:two-component system sensor histidine kinase/response regulator
MLCCAAVDQSVDTYTKDTYINVALNNSKLMLHVVNDILDYSQISFDRIRIASIEFNLKDKLSDLVKLVSYQARLKAVDVVCNYDESSGIPELVKTDPNRLSQILLNLFNNALKFTETGTITLEVRRLANSATTLEFAVEDSGLGIKPEDQAKLFDLFTKIDLGNKTNLNANGAGLGLSLCQKLLRLMRSDGLKVESQYQRGSRFFFHLPCIPDH